MGKISLNAKMTILLPIAVAVALALSAWLTDLLIKAEIRHQIASLQSLLGQDVAQQITTAVVATRPGVLLGIVALMVISGITIHLLARRGMAPIRELLRRSADIASDSTQRLPMAEEAELSLLAGAINALLTKNEQQQTVYNDQLHFVQVLMDTIPIPIFYKDVECCYIGCNAAFERVIGLSKQELVGKKVYNLASAERAKVYDRADREILDKGGTQEYESVVGYADGTVHAVIFYKKALVDAAGKITGIVGSFLDITERKQAETALVRQKEFTDNLLQNATVAVFVLNVNHQVIIWNRACEALTGVSAADIIGTDRHWSAFYHEQRPCLADLVIEHTVNQALNLYEIYRKSPVSEEGLQAEGWYTLAGRRRYILFSAAPVRDATGNIVAAIETIEDITERKEREEELSAIAQAVSIVSGEGFFPAVTHYIAKMLGTDYVFIGSLDPKTRTRVHTMAVAAHGGFGHNFSFKLQGTPCESLVWKGLCCIPDAVQQHFPEDQLLAEMQIQGYIGVPLMGMGKIPLGVLVALHSKPIPFPERAGTLMKIFASRAAAELQHRQDEVWMRKLSHVVSQSPVSIVITDTKGRIEFVNPKFTKVTGYSADEVEGATPAILKSGETPKAVYAELWQTISHGKIWEGVFHNRRKDGELYWERAYIAPIKDERGEITNYIGIKEDITEHKRLEAALQHVQKMEAIGQLAGGVAHDFNNILTAVIGYASIVEIHAGANELLKSAIHQITKAAERGASLTKSLLTFSRKQAANTQTVDLNEVVVRGEKLLSRLISENIELKLTLALEPLTVIVDSLEIEQVLMNLVTNARDAMPEGGSIELETGKDTIDSQFIRVHGFGVIGDYAIIRVTDHGIGMDEKTLQRIFEPFYTTKENGKGTGLGLAIVYNIVKSHKGNVICVSSPTVGTTVTVYLPLAVSTATELPAELEVIAPQRGNELVLVAEDDLDIRRLLRMFLEEHGYRVVEAGDGEEAIARFRELSDEITLVMLDAGLPKLSGPEALAVMRRQRPELKGIIVSGYAQEKCLADDNGRTGFLAKPVGPGDLLRAVRKELDR